MDRREFLRAAGVAAGAAALGGLLAGCGGSDEPSPSAAGVTGTTAGGRLRKVRLGFIALTDASSVIMARELGYFAERGLDVEVTKQASWPATRDALLNGQIDGAHCLFGMPFSVATGVGGTGSRDLKVAMMLNQNGQAITLARDLAEVGYGDLAAAKELLESADAPELAMTFPGGTHDIWLRYWLLATGADTSKVRISPVPPPQMVQNMSVGNVKGYCVGEPWNAVAVKQGIGFTHLATQDLWLHHPEKALVVSSRFAETQADTLKDVMGAVLQAGRWLDQPANRADAAGTVGVEAYINAPAAEIRNRLTGVYDLGAGLGTKDFGGKQMMFHRDGATNAPRRAYGYWALAQYQRLGLLTSKPDYSIVDEIVLRDLYEEAADAAGVKVPDDDMAPFEVKLDGAEFNPKKPDAEAARA